MQKNIVIDLNKNLYKGYANENNKNIRPLEVLLIEGSPILDMNSAQIMIKVGKRKFNDL